MTSRNFLRSRPNCVVSSMREVPSTDFRLRISRPDEPATYSSTAFLPIRTPPSRSKKMALGIVVWSASKGTSTGARFTILPNVVLDVPKSIHPRRGSISRPRISGFAILQCTVDVCYGRAADRGNFPSGHGFAHRGHATVAAPD